MATVHPKHAQQAWTPHRLAHLSWVAATAAAVCVVVLVFGPPGFALVAITGGSIGLAACTPESRRHRLYQHLRDWWQRNGLPVRPDPEPALPPPADLSAPLADVLPPVKSHAEVFGGASPITEESSVTTDTIARPEVDPDAAPTPAAPPAAGEPTPPATEQQQPTDPAAPAIVTERTVLDDLDSLLGTLASYCGTATRHDQQMHARLTDARSLVSYLADEMQRRHLSLPAALQAVTEGEALL